MNFLRYRTLLYCILLINISLTALPLDTLKKSCGNIVADLFGEDKLSKANQDKIEQIIIELDMQSYNIDIRCMNEFAYAHTGRDNALVFPGMYYLFIDEEFFEQLSEAEQKFMIGHELMHMLNNHGIKRLAFLAGAIGIFLITEDIVLNDAILGRKIKDKITHHFGENGYIASRILWPILFTTASILASYKLSRIQEIDADTQIVAKLGKHIISSGIALLERYEDECGSRIACSNFNALLNSQPTFKERIMSLKALQNTINTDQ